MSISSLVKGKILGTVIQKVADSEPRTTIAGAALSGLIASNIDYNKLVQGDTQQIATAIAALLVAVISYFTNHKKVTGQAPAAEVPPAEKK